MLIGEPFRFVFPLDFDRRLSLAELGDAGVPNRFDAALSHGFVQLAFVVLKHQAQAVATVDELDAVFLRKGQSGFDGAVAAADDEDVFPFVVFRAVEPMVDWLAVLAGDVQLARVAALAPSPG